MLSHHTISLARVFSYLSRPKALPSRSPKISYSKLPFVNNAKQQGLSTKAGEYIDQRAVSRVHAGMARSMSTSRSRRELMSKFAFLLLGRSSEIIAHLQVGSLCSNSYPHHRSTDGTSHSGRSCLGRVHFRPCSPDQAGAVQVHVRMQVLH